MREEPKLFGAPGRQPASTPQDDVNLLDVEPEDDVEALYEEDVYEDVDETAGGRRRLPVKLIAGGAALGAIVAGGLVAAIFLGVTEETRPIADVPLITADPTPFKQRPDDPGGLEVPYQDIEILEALDDEDDPGEEDYEVLLPEPEEPMDREAVQAAEAPESDLPVIDVIDTTTADDFVIQDKDGELTGTEIGEEAGDLVTGLPVPPLPGVPPTKPGASSAPAVASDVAAQDTGTQDTGSDSSLSFDDVAASLGGDGGAASVAPAAGAIKVQIAAFGSEQGALDAWAVLQARHIAILGTYQPVVDKAELSSGTYYRLQVGPIATDAEARQLCDALRVRQVDCLIVAP